MSEEFVTIARVLGPQGRRGEVAAALHTDFPERFADQQRLSLLAADGKRQELELEEHWLHKGHVILKFRGVDSISQAETLADAEVQIRAGERRKLEAGAAYVSDLVGCTVISLTPAPTELGSVQEVQFGAGEAPLLVIKAQPGNKEILLPFAAEYLKKVDVSAKRIEMVLPEGMLELDAPLNQEEKERQARGN